MVNSIERALNTDGFHYENNTYYRICPNCGEHRSLKNRQTFMVMYRKRDVFKYCSKCAVKGIPKTEEHKRKMSKPKTEEHKRKLSISALNRIIDYDTEQSRRIKISKAVSGKNNPMYGKGYKLKGSNNGMYGKTHTDDVKTFLRKRQTKRYKEQGGFCNYNKLACEYFDWLNKWNGWNGIHAENGGEFTIDGYWLDFYEPYHNIVVEWDEPHHYSGGVLKEVDVKRQSHIIDVLGCSFYRIIQNSFEIIKIN